jgi:hypothetical protein
MSIATAYMSFMPCWATRNLRVRILAGSERRNGSFAKTPLVRYVRESRCYDPFYWEDIEWGACAPGSMGIRCSAAGLARVPSASRDDRALLSHRGDRPCHRAPIACFSTARNRATAFGADWLMESRLRSRLPNATRDGCGASRARNVRRRRRAVRSSPSPPRLAVSERCAVELARLRSVIGYGRSNRKSITKRSRLLLATPFAVYPPRHGGARRIAGLLAHLRQDYDVILVSDEAATLRRSESRGIRSIHVRCIWSGASRMREK